MDDSKDIYEYFEDYRALPDDQKSKFRQQAMDKMYNYHAYPYTGSVLGATAAGVPTYALSRWLGASPRLSTMLGVGAGLAGAYYGYNK